MTDGFHRADPTPRIGRRNFLRLGAAAASATVLLGPTQALAGRYSIARQVRFHNLNTGEKLNAEYWVRGRYLPDALRAVDWVLRDHRTDERTSIAPELLDVLAALHTTMDADRPFTVICGYRTGHTNAEMRASGHWGVARNSYHTVGKAIDINLPGTSLVNLCRGARALQAGGVGFYPQSDFVHLDVGPLRHW